MLNHPNDIDADVPLWCICAMCAVWLVSPIIVIGASFWLYSWVMA